MLHRLAYDRSLRDQISGLSNSQVEEMTKASAESHLSKSAAMVAPKTPGTHRVNMAGLGMCAVVPGVGKRNKLTSRPCLAITVTCYFSVSLL